MEIEKPPFGKYHGTMDTKITGQKYDEKQDICIASKYFPHKKNDKEKTGALQQRNLADT